LKPGEHAHQSLFSPSIQKREMEGICVSRGMVQANAAVFEAGGTQHLIPCHQTGHFEAVVLGCFKGVQWKAVRLKKKCRQDRFDTSLQTTKPASVVPMDFKRGRCSTVTLAYQFQDFLYKWDSPLLPRSLPCMQDPDSEPMVSLWISGFPAWVVGLQYLCVKFWKGFAPRLGRGRALKS